MGLRWAGAVHVATLHILKTSSRKSERFFTERHARNLGRHVRVQFSDAKFHTHREGEREFMEKSQTMRASKPTVGELTQLRCSRTHEETESLTH